MSDLKPPRRPRADAVRNREHIVRAAIDLLVEEGSTVALETIARRAGVGIATLYRHFPDRTVLLRQVAVDMLTQSARSATMALAEEPDAFTALVRHLHASIDLRTSVVVPMLAQSVPDDDELAAVRAESDRSLEMLVKAAHDEGSLRPDVGAGDICLLMIRVARPLPLPFDAEANREMSHRHAEILLDGLLQFLAVEPLPGHPLELAELDHMLGGVRPVPAAGNGGRSRTNGS
ncbi:helix-turn-helix domain-containing protein [Actinophytocola sp.]|uniref:TetR/AcrR family transcriptional regulator n=1 Tax=Actinophytocola sp. TaxID=1872138 RepID=UPI002ED3AF06